MLCLQNSVPRLGAAAPSLASGSPAGALTVEVTHRPPRRTGRFSLLAGVLLCWLFALVAPASAKTAMQEYVEAMQPGWNLGNSLDATPSETAWGNPPVTQELIQQIAAQGFKSIRIPVTWNTGNRVGPAPSYTVDPAFMDRVEQVVNWALDAGLYVMLNQHHDSYTYESQPAGYLDRYQAVWEQIALRFRDHPRELMLETINEPNFPHAATDAEKIALVNELNSIAFAVIRSSGGGNSTRPIVMPTVVTNASQHFLDGLKALMVELNDPNLIATVHFYGYWPFSVNIAGVTTVDDSVLADINTSFTSAHDTFVADGIPVVVGELGILAWDTGIQGVERGELLKFFEIVTATAKANDLTWQIWDNGKHFDRTGHFWKDPEQIGYILGGVTARSSTAETDLVFVESNAPADVAIPFSLNGNSFVSLTNGSTTLTPGVDYTLDGNVLTLKASLLAQYASGGYGEKAVLTANFSAGMPWKLHVRHLGVPVLSAAASIKVADLIIPAAFNGDLVATMEAHYVSGNLPYPGRQNWTQFKEYTDAYLPNYTNNTIAIKKSFFEASTNDPIDLTFHMWSGRKLNYRLTLTPGGDIVTDPQEWSIYTEGLSGWNNWGSWASHNPDNTTVVHSGTKAISVDAGAYAAVVLARNSWEPAVNTSAYKTLVFWIHGGTVGGQQLGVGIDWSLPWVGISAPAANTWKKVEIPLSSFGAEGKANITNFMIQNWTGAGAPTYYIDDIHLTTAYASDIVFVNGGAAPVITSATSASGMFNVPFSYSVSAINGATAFSATGLPAGLAIDETTGVISGTPTAAGSYVVTLSATNASGSGTQQLAIAIAPAPATITLPGSDLGAVFSFTYDGAPAAPEITTSPAGLPVTVTYNGSTAAPTLPGTYHVVVTSADANYSGSAEGTLVITVTALVRHAPTLNGDLDGSLQLLSGESLTVNSSASVAGDLLVPGMPAVQSNGAPIFAGVVDADGAAAPADYSVTLNSGTVVRYVVRRVDPIAMPVVTMPALPTGTRDATLNNASQTVGDFATIRDLTLNGNAGAVAVPAGVYGSFTVNGNSSLVLGVAGATEPAVYELQGLALNGNASVEIVGPVTLKLANGTSFNGAVGSAEHPEWLELQIAQSGLTLNGNATVHAIVTAPSGSVIVNGALHGRVSAGRLTINGGGVLEDPAQ